MTSKTIKRSSSICVKRNDSENDSDTSDESYILRDNRSMFDESYDTTHDRASIGISQLNGELYTRPNNEVNKNNMLTKKKGPQSLKEEFSLNNRSPLIDTYDTLGPGSSNSDSDDDRYTTDDGVNIGAVFAETRDLYKNELSQKFPDYTQILSKDVEGGDIESAIDELLETDESNHVQSKDKSCANCKSERRVIKAKSFKKGQHIRLPGAKFTYTFNRKVLSLYTHHAIVKQINEAGDQKVEMVLIHFTKAGEKMNIHETTETYDLEHDEIFIVEYALPRYEAGEIVKRAESQLPENSKEESDKKFKSYNPFTCNCEHFATWCVIGAENSFQVKSIRNTIKGLLTKTAGVGFEISRFIKRFLYDASEGFAARFEQILTELVPGFFLASTGFIYLIYCCVRTSYLLLKKRTGQLCKACLKREIVTLWTHFGTFIVTSGISYILVHFLFPLFSSTVVGIPLLLVITLLSIALQWGIGKIRRALMAPYACDKIPVVKLSDLNKGNMITFKYFGFEHFAIVTEVHEDNEESTIGKIRCVHYGLKSWNILSRRQVIEELIHFDLRDGSKKLKMVDCKTLQSYPCHQIVDRVRARVGERNWNGVSNRSDHLCFWAQVKTDNEPETDNTNNGNKGDIGETKTKHKSSLCVGQTNIYIRKEVKLGDVVKYDGIKGIVVKLDDIIQCEAQTFEMEVMVYRNYHARRMKKTVDLKEKWMMVKNYHPAHGCSMEERVQRACGKEDKKCPHWLEETFIECCILKNDTAQS